MGFDFKEVDIIGDFKAGHLWEQGILESGSFERAGHLREQGFLRE
jgi:hypothetical protein